MFFKQAVCISTAAGAGMGSTNKDMAHSTFFWGIARTYKYGVAVMETSWEKVSAKKKQAIDNRLEKLAHRIVRKQGYARPSVKTKIFFNIMRLMQKHGWNEADVAYWKEKGWAEKKRPWK